MPFLSPSPDVEAQDFDEEGNYRPGGVPTNRSGPNPGQANDFKSFGVPHGVGSRPQAAAAPGGWSISGVPSSQRGDRTLLLDLQLLSLAGAHHHRALAWDALVVVSRVVAVHLDAFIGTHDLAVRSTPEVREDAPHGPTALPGLEVHSADLPR